MAADGGVFAYVSLGAISVTRKNQTLAFTLIELVLALAILSLMAAIALPSYVSMVEKIRIDTAITDIKILETQIDRFFSNNLVYPDSLADIGAAPVDPWGNPYQYLNIGSVKGKGKLRKDHSQVPINSDYDLYSKGEDGDSVSPLTAKKSRDDIVRGRNGGFVGLAAEF